MKTWFLLLAVLLLTAVVPSRAEDKPVDFNRAKELYEKSQRGETLTAEEQDYIEQAKRQFSQRTGLTPEQMEKLRALHEKSRRGESLTPDEQKLLDEARAKVGEQKPDAAPATGGDFDWNRARAIHERLQKGETLSTEDQKHYDEARRRMQSGQGPGRRTASPGADGFDWQKARQVFEKRQRGEALSADDQKLLEEAMRRRGGGGGAPAGGGERGAPVADETLLKELVPLTELKGSYKGQDGGLYGGGQNQPPAPQKELAAKAVAQIQPLNGEGKPDAAGKVVLLSIGMSNTTQEFSVFVQKANADPRKSEQVVIVDGAQGGKDATAWAKADATPWTVAEQRMKTAGVTPQQVQVVWVKQALIAPQKEYPAEVERLRERFGDIVRVAKEKYPNLRLAFLSSRTYGGYATTRLNPEPHAFEGALAVRGIIQRQMSGDPEFNGDPAKGAAKAPVLLWGPYLWAAGVTPRQADGFSYAPADFGGDGTHPSRSGQEKVAGLLLDFFTKDAHAAPWFVKKG